MDPQAIDRRRFLTHTAMGVGVTAAGLTVGCQRSHPPLPARVPVPKLSASVIRKPYDGPNVILVRFGGGVRRLETIAEPHKTYCPFVYHELYENKGILLNNVEIHCAPGIETNHSQCTLYMITGQYEHFEDVTHKPFQYRFEAQNPTVFEYFRHYYDIPEHQALVLNCEDRPSDDLYNFSNHDHYGVRYRSQVLSLYRYKVHQLRKELANENLRAAQRRQLEDQFWKLEKYDYRKKDGHLVNGHIEGFWDNWSDYYGTSRLVQPRGDRLLTALAIRAMKELRPRLMLINYCDADYVHWGPRDFYRRGIAVNDAGIQEMWTAAQADDGDGGSHSYRDNTVFLIVPDCGRDSNPCMAIPYQHHFGSKTSHEIWAIAAGPGIAQSKTPVDRLHQQTSVAGTIGAIMKFPTPFTGAGAYEEMLA